MAESEQERATLTELEGRLTAARASLAANVARRAAIAFSVEIGDGEARKEAAGLLKDAMKLDADVHSLEAAVAEAGRRVAVAAAIETDDAQREHAQQALDMLDAFAQRGAALDAKLAEFVAEYVALNSDFRKLEALGYGPTTPALVSNNMRRATSTKLMFTDLQQDFLAPGQRVDFVSTIEGWARVCRLKAEARLNRHRTAA